MPATLTKKKRKKRTREIPRMLDLSTKVKLGKRIKAREGDKEKLPAFTLVANTGVPMDVEGFFAPVIIDMTGNRFAKRKTPVIADHDTTKRIGHTTEQSVDPKRIIAKGVVSSTMRVAQGFVEDAKNGFPFEVSVGSEIVKAEFVEEGQTATVNGKSWKGPLIVARKSLNRELSITVLGADGNTVAKIAAARKDPLTLDLEEPLIMATSLKKFAKSLGYDPTKLKAKQKTRIKKAFKKLQASEGGDGDPVDDDDDDVDDDFDDDDDDDTDPEGKVRSKKSKTPGLGKKQLAKARQQIVDEETRLDDIRDIAKRYSSRKISAKIKLDGKGFTTVKAAKNYAMKSDTTADELELAILRSSRADSGRTKAPGMILRGKDNSAKALECAIVRSLGVTANKKNEVTGEKYGYENEYDNKTLEASEDHRDICLHQLMDMTIQAATGDTFHGNRKSRTFVREFVRANRMLQASGVSTMAASNILENVANKALLTAYKAQETVWQFITGIRQLSDFKAHSFYRLTATGGYSKVNQAGELKQGKFTDEKYSVEADTYGMILALTRQAMMNDDLNAFNDIPNLIGRLAALAIEYAVLKMVLNPSAGFYNLANNGNFQSGADTDLDVTGLKKVSQAFINQTHDDKPILYAPDRILVGAQDSHDAGSLFNDKNYEFSDTERGKGKSTKNPHVGKYRPLVSPILNNTNIKDMDGAAITGQNGNQWFMFTPPELFAAFYIGFVNGVQIPVLESEDGDFDSLSMQWRSYHDWGTGEGDPKAVQKSKGEA